MRSCAKAGTPLSRKRPTTSVAAANRPLILFPLIVRTQSRGVQQFNRADGSFASIGRQLALIMAKPVGSVILAMMIWLPAAPKLSTFTLIKIGPRSRVMAPPNAAQYAKLVPN